MNINNSKLYVTKNDGYEDCWKLKSKIYLIPEAIFKLGAMYYEGIIIERDYAESLFWWKLANEKKFPLATINLAHLYSMGFGTKVDYALASEYQLESLGIKIYPPIIDWVSGMAESVTKSEGYFWLKILSGYEVKGANKVFDCLKESMTSKEVVASIHYEQSVLSRPAL